MKAEDRLKLWQEWANQRPAESNFSLEESYMRWLEEVIQELRGQK